MGFKNKTTLAPEFLGSSFGTVLDNQAWAVANEAVLFPIWTPAPFVFDTIHLKCSTAAGNVDIGIYDALFNAIWRLGSSVLNTAIPSFTIAAQTLNPGAYWLALVLTDIVTARISAALTPQAPDMSTMAQAGVGVPLPATLAPAKAAKLTPLLNLYKA